MMRYVNFSLFLCLAVPAAAQDVRPIPDVASYATAAVNPALAVLDAWHSGKPCRFGQLAVSEAIGNVAALTLQHFIVSPRPCAGCPPHGMPSDHVTNAGIGISSHWGIGVGFVLGTAALRVAANRHTWPQVAAGAGLGIASEWIGRSVVRCQ